MAIRHYLQSLNMLCLFVSTGKNIDGSIHVTGKTDPSGGSVPAGPNLTGGMEPGIWSDYKYEHYICLQCLKK